MSDRSGNAAWTLFKDLIEPGLERIPVLEVMHGERHHGRDFVIVQTIRRNVFTEFDRKLSRHLAATRGSGFPAFTVTVTVGEKDGAGGARPLAQSHHASVPHALKAIAERAIRIDGRAELTNSHEDPSAAGRGPGTRRVVTSDDTEALDAALAVCRFLGEAEFLSLSGDFDVILAAPPGEQRPMIAHVANGSISIPCASGDSISPFECPLHGFANHISQSVMAQGYMAKARHALVSVKEAAVQDFREVAERQILSFDRALAGRSLDGYRLDSVAALVQRLTTGLGPGLNGLSEDARITALDWSATIEATHDKEKQSCPPSVRIASA